MPYEYAFQIAATQAGLIVLPRLGLPFPDDWTYFPFAKSETRGDGTGATFGFPVASWIYETLAQYQLDKYLALFANDTDSTVQVYIQTYTDRGATLSTIVRKCLMHRPVDGQGKTLVRGSSPSGANLTDVTIQFTRLEAS
jgi:hypothetical protein